MKLHELKNLLAQNPAALVRFRLPIGDFIPAHAHVTEVARIDKRFIDCGGTLRTDALCRLQTWFADDVDHRLTAGKLAKIFTLAEGVLLTDDLEVDPAPDGTSHGLPGDGQMPAARCAIRIQSA